MSTLDERVQQLEADVERFRDDGASAGAIVLACLLVLAALIAILRPAAQALGGDGWTAIAAVGAWIGAFATIAYVVFTVKLWTSAAQQVKVQRKISEATLMQSMMVEYDGLRGDIDHIQSWFMECAANGIDPIDRFVDEIEYQAQAVDDARFKVSRFFVRTRKLVTEGYLPERLARIALGGQAIEDVFLMLVDPLDEAKAGAHYGIGDRMFYRELLEKYPRPARFQKIG